MKIIFYFIPVSVILGTLLACPHGLKADELSTGRGIYINRCQMCHGKNGKGDGPASAAFSRKPIDFTNPDFWKNNPEERITKAVESGFKQMPQIDLRPEQIKAVIEYLSQTFKPSGNP